MADEILALSSSADFYPGLGEDDDIEDYQGDRIHWTFALPRSQAVGAGVYRIEFVRTLAEEKALGNPLGLTCDSGSDPQGEDALAAECEASQSGGAAASPNPLPETPHEG